MRTGEDRVQISSINQPVSIGSIRTEPGDVMMVDVGGAVMPCVQKLKMLPESLMSSRKWNRG